MVKDIDFKWELKGFSIVPKAFIDFGILLWMYEDYFCAQVEQWMKRVF